jgi:hypothetical protein
MSSSRIQCQHPNLANSVKDAPAVNHHCHTASHNQHHHCRCGAKRPKPSLFGNGRGPDVRDFGVPGHTPLLLQVAVAAKVEERLEALGVEPEAALLLGIASLEKSVQAVKCLARDRADVVPLPVHPYRKRGELAEIGGDGARLTDVSDVSDRLVEA